MSEIKIKWIALDKHEITDAQFVAICELIDAVGANIFSVPADVAEAFDSVMDAIHAVEQRTIYTESQRVVPDVGDY